jgi:hypothetical protein
MVQFQTALAKFVSRHFIYVSAYDRRVWVTKELVVELEQLPDEDDVEDDELEGDQRG